MSGDSDVGELHEWLTALVKQVRRLRTDQYIWEELQRMISANDDLRQPSHFYAWMKDMYVAGMAMAIRRQVDADSRTMSFRRFLTRIKGDPSVVSRARYRALYLPEDDASPAEIDDTYDRFVGEGKLQPTSDDIQQQIDQLKDVTSKFVTFANQVIAHQDRQKPVTLPTFAEVDTVVGHMERLAQHYVQLFEAKHLMMGASLNYDWKAIFRVAWIRGSAPRSG